MADTPHEKPIDPEHKEPQPEKENQDAPQILRAELQIPHSVIDTYNTEQKKKNRLEWWKLSIEAATLIVIVIYTIVAYHQWATMRNSTDAAKMSADAAKSAADIASKTLIETQKQSTAIQAAAIANAKAVELATQNIKIIQDQFRLDQRAWITITNLDFEKPLHAGEKFRIKITLNNTGKTPAAHVTFHYKIWEEVDKKSIREREIEDTESGELYYGPGDERYVSVFRNEDVLQSEINDIYNGTASVFVNIEFTYFDIYETQKIRHSRACYQYSPSFNKFIFGNRCCYMD